MNCLLKHRIKLLVCSLTVKYTVYDNLSGTRYLWKLDIVQQKYVKISLPSLYQFSLLHKESSTANNVEENVDIARWQPKKMYHL